MARTIFAAQSEGRTDDDALIESAERIGTCVPDGLARWFGTYGSLALVTRALAIAQAGHPALASVIVSSSPTPRLIGVSASVQSHGTSATADAIITLLATLYELLSRLIGDDMALGLLSQCAAPSASNGQAKSKDGQRSTHFAAGPSSGGEEALPARSTDEALSQTMDEQ
ncbi:MAG: hypothetical protein ABI601_17385 [bacterium]